MTNRTVPAEIAEGPLAKLPSLRELERHAIFRTLRATKGDKKMAMQILGISRATLYRKLKEYDGQ